ncbi:metal ABC transporter substrate-binding protein [uncultured Brachyspira sp.]|uniref:metal ABC transporter substrate-binding protein n=1 Tax=uncultured Brachyspira sp. TaxID=221953 RepID=UPI0025E32577|nr:metal ABC transporter substrate-binding protein [uncultured Brachyspira sp.]
MQKRILILTFFILFISCRNTNTNTNDDNKIKASVSIFPIYDFTRNIAEDNINLQMIIKPGIEIHSFNSTPADIINIQNSDVFIYIGGESEKWAEKIIASIDTNGKKIIRLMDYVNVLDEEIAEGMEEDEEHNHNDEHNHDEDVYDEHIWVSPKNAVLIVNTICKALSDIDASNADIYKANADKYNQKLLALDNEIREALNSSKRKNIVFGDRFPFRYLTEEYGLEYRAPFKGCSSQSDASPKTIAYLINYIKDNNIPYLYYIELSNGKIADILIEHTGINKLKLHSVQNITKEEFDLNASYLSIMRDNLESLKKGLN